MVILRNLHVFAAIVAAVFYQAHGAASVAVPPNSCYVMDNTSHIHDFSSWIGNIFQLEGKEDLVIRFCKDVETRSQSGYVSFGRYDKLNYFVTGSGHYDFVQEFYNGDLDHCEQTYDKMGRTAQVNILCGGCPDGKCQGKLGCICNVTYESNNCRVVVELAIPCEKKGPRVFQGFTVGFHPRSWEVVYNGMTQLGYETVNEEFRFPTEQTHVALYMTAVSSLSNLVRKPIVKIFPEKGLKVSLSGSGATGNPPTTLSPTVLIVNWRCEKDRVTPYEVNVTVPVEGYEPVEFTLTKMCEHKQNEEGDSTRGWAIFGVISCIFIVGSTLFCSGWFIYKTRMENQHGLDALPGMTILSACLETVSGRGQSYPRPDDPSRPFVNQGSRATWESTETNYGSI
jgi:hypothetical protein